MTGDKQKPAHGEFLSRDDSGVQSRGSGLRWLALLIALGAGGAWWYWNDSTMAGLLSAGAPPGGAPRPATAPPPMPVTVARPLVQDVTEWNEYTGQFAAVEYVELRARVSGTLTEIHFKDGDTVNRGDLLFVIDPRPFEAEVRQVEANLDRDRAQSMRATLDLKRSVELAQKNYAPQQQLDQARANADATAATVKGDEAALAQARLNLEFTRITAPVSGRIGAHQVSVGNMVIGGSTTTTTLLATIVSLDPIQFNFDVSEADFLAYQRAIAAGRATSARESVVPVQARLADERAWSHEGQVNFIDNQLNRGAGTLRIRAIFTNPEHLFTPGQFARVRMPGSLPHAALLIPDRAVLADQARKIVMTVGPDGTVAPHPVVLGPVIKGLRIVRSGLTAEDSIIIDGLMRARPGAKVAPQPGTFASDPQADLADPGP